MDSKLKKILEDISYLYKKDTEFVVVSVIAIVAIITITVRFYK